MAVEVSLLEMLDARERRVHHQQELLEQYHKPLICFTMNIAGPIKDSPLIRRGFARGQQLLRQQFFRAKLTPLSAEAHCAATGCEAFYVLDADPLDAWDAATAAQQAVRALLYEVTTTPKPGLVDRRNSGSHTDMDSFTFMSSAAALYPYFEACAKVGRETMDRPAPETFAALRPLGCEAEGEMLDATNGVNTHKGAVFSIGITCAALGRLNRAEWCDPARVMQEVAAMTKGLTQQDLADVTTENAVTAGQKLYAQYGITGVRGQVEAGLLAALDDRFIAEHLSPGGSADLLALTYLLHFFKTEEHLHV